MRDRGLGCPKGRVRPGHFRPGCAAPSAGNVDIHVVGRAPLAPPVIRRGGVRPKPAAHGPEALDRDPGGGVREGIHKGPVLVFALAVSAATPAPVPVVLEVLLGTDPAVFRAVMGALGGDLTASPTATTAAPAAARLASRLGAATPADGVGAAAAVAAFWANPGLGGARGSAADALRALGKVCHRTGGVRTDPVVLSHDHLGVDAWGREPLGG